MEGRLGIKGILVMGYESTEPVKWILFKTGDGLGR